MFDQDEFNDHFALWQLEAEIHCPEWPLYKSKEASQLLRERAASFGGYVGLSHFTRAFFELKTSGCISQLRQSKPAVAEVSELTAEQYHSLPSAVLQRRFRNDQEFRSQVQSLIDAGQI